MIKQAEYQALIKELGRQVIEAAAKGDFTKYKGLKEILLNDDEEMRVLLTIEYAKFLAKKQA
jgi:hypothetical protein